MGKHQILTIFIILGLAPHIMSQPADSISISPPILSFRLSYSNMWVVPTHDFVSSQNATGEAITDGHNVSAEVIFQTNGNKEWHQLYNFPKYGFGVQTLWFPQTSEIGNPLAVYAMLEGPIHRWKKSYLSYAFHFGVAMGWEPYNPVTNPYNYLMGGPLALYAHLGVLYHQNLGKRWGAEASLGFSHASNGNLKQPNFGINFLDPRLALTYQLQDEQPIHKPTPLSVFTPKNEVSLSMSVGTKQLNVFGTDSASKAAFGDESFTIYNWVLLYQRQISRRSKIGAGIDFTIDPSDNAHGIVVGDKSATYPAPFNEEAKLALILSYELSIGKLALILQPGFYFYRTIHDPTPLFYQRIGARYDIYKGFYAGTALRAVNFGQADWIELTAGYKIHF
ncbi:MAG: hypothetical protein ACI85Q_002196 [Salibacteraceae bacterium]|jgi:hypothetical protein